MDETLRVLSREVFAERSQDKTTGTLRKTLAGLR